MRFTRGMLVEVVKAHPANRKYIGERFILTERGRDIDGMKTWLVPKHWDVELAEEPALRPVVDDGKRKLDWSDTDLVWSPFAPVDKHVSTK